MILLTRAVRSKSSVRLLDASKRKAKSSCERARAYMRKSMSERKLKPMRDVGVLSIPGFAFRVNFAKLHE